MFFFYQNFALRGQLINSTVKFYKNKKILIGNAFTFKADYELEAFIGRQIPQEMTEKL